MNDLVSCGVLSHPGGGLTSKGINIYSSFRFCCVGKPGYCPKPVETTTLEEACYFAEQNQAVIHALIIFQSILQPKHKRPWLTLINKFDAQKIQLAQRVAALTPKIVPTPPAPAPIVTVAVFHAEIQKLNAQIAALTQENLVLTQRLALEVESRQEITAQLAENNRLVKQLIEMLARL